MLTRAYNTITIDSEGIATKSSENERLVDEILYYQTLPLELKKYFPRIYQFQTTRPPYSIQLEYYGYKNLGMCEIEPGDYHFVFPALKSILLKFQDRIIYGGGLLDIYRREMYIDKTINEYNKLTQDNEFFSLISQKLHIHINGLLYENFSVIWEDIKKLVTERLINNNPFTVIHGDFCFSNILSSSPKIDDKTFFRLIDPRGRFGVQGNYGDPLYDYAKLRHSYKNRYEDIIADNFEVRTGEDSIIYGFKTDRAENLDDIFQQTFPNVDLVNVKLIEGLIWIGMIARHYDSLDRQKVMYATGVRCLNDVLKCV
jgi:hypothetical protein